MDANERNNGGNRLYTEAESPTGVDDFLLLELLRLSPAERLRRGQARANAVHRLQRAVKRPR